MRKKTKLFILDSNFRVGIAIFLREHFSSDVFFDLIIQGILKLERLILLAWKEWLPARTKIHVTSFSSISLYADPLVCMSARWTKVCVSIVYPKAKCFFFPFAYFLFQSQVTLIQQVNLFLVPKSELHALWRRDGVILQGS